MSNDWKVFKKEIAGFIFDPQQPDHKSKFMVLWWKKHSKTMMVGCAKCMRGMEFDLPCVKDSGEKIISNKKKKDWWATLIYMCGCTKATGNERGCGGDQASTEKTLTPKAAGAKDWQQERWIPKQQQQDHKGWQSSTDGHCGGGRGSGHGSSKSYGQQSYNQQSYGQQQFYGQQSYGQQQGRGCPPQQQDKGWGRDSYKCHSGSSHKGSDTDKGFHGYQESSNDRRDTKNQHFRSDDRDRAAASTDNSGRGHGSSDRGHGSSGRGQDSRRDDRDARDQRRSVPEVDLLPRHDGRDRDRRGNDSRSDRSSDRRPSGSSSREMRRDDSRSPRREQNMVREMIKEELQNMVRDRGR